jgi:formylmethanofuran dehydrogenase subunit A
MRLLIANGYVIDPAQQVNAGRNVMIEDGRIVGLPERSETAPEGVQVLDATGLIVHRSTHASARTRSGIQRNDRNRNSRSSGRWLDQRVRNAQYGSD